MLPSRRTWVLAAGVFDGVGTSRFKAGMYVGVSTHNAVIGGVEYPVLGRTTRGSIHAVKRNKDGSLCVVVYCDGPGAYGYHAFPSQYVTVIHAPKNRRSVVVAPTRGKRGVKPKKEEPEEVEEEDNEVSDSEEE